jgi:arylsulfatase A-like enzyme
MRTRPVLFTAALATLVACAPPPPPNIVFVFTDDHATQAIGTYGGRLAGLDPTPTIDRLAREGMRFDNAFVTNGICAPSRAVILTGMHSHRNGVLTNAERFDSSQVTFPQLLQAAGYQTAMVGKWHLKSDPVGFDYWKPFLLMYQHKAPHREWSPGPEHLTAYDSASIPEPATLFDAWEGRTSAAATQEMTIAGHMHLYHDLKVPPVVTEPDDRMSEWADGRRERMTESQRNDWDAAYDPKIAAFRASDLDGGALVRWKYRRYMEDYLSSIASVDANLDRLLAYLDSAGLSENTVVVYASDQGFFLGEHGWYDKRWMYEESLRMPLIVRWPGVVESGATSRDLVQNLDLAQTFLELAGVSAPTTMQGRSLVPLLRGDRSIEWRDAIYYHYYEFPGVHAVQRHYGVRTDRYKLIHYYLIDEWELFDLERDPDELRSVYEELHYADVRSRLTARLAELRAGYGVPETDPVPLPEEQP